MKKIKSPLLSLCLILSMGAAMGITADAATINSIGGTQPESIKGTYVAGAPSATVYEVDVTWGSMEFTYTDASQGTWNPSTHAYENPTAAAWSCGDGANAITVTNHSNAGITAQLSFAADSEHSGITAEFYKDAALTSSLKGISNEFYVETADAYTTNTVDGIKSFPAGQRTGKAYMKIADGTLTGGTGVTLGTVTVTLKENNLA